MPLERGQVAGSFRKGIVAALRIEMRVVEGIEEIGCSPEHLRIVPGSRMLNLGVGTDAMKDGGEAETGAEVRPTFVRGHGEGMLPPQGETGRRYGGHFAAAEQGAVEAVGSRPK